MVCCNPDLATEQKAVRWVTFHLLLVSIVTATGIALDLYVASGIGIATFLVCAVILAMKAPKSGSIAYVAIAVLILGLLGGTSSQLPRMFSDMEELRTGNEDLETFIDLCDQVAVNFTRSQCEQQAIDLALTNEKIQKSLVQKPRLESSRDVNDFQMFYVCIQIYIGATIYIMIVELVLALVSLWAASRKPAARNSGKVAGAAGAAV
jgi:hypothetical protein